MVEQQEGSVKLIIGSDHRSQFKRSVILYMQIGQGLVDNQKNQIVVNRTKYRCNNIIIVTLYMIHRVRGQSDLPSSLLLTPSPLLLSLLEKNLLIHERHCTYTPKNSFKCTTALSRSNWNLELLVVKERGKPSFFEKNSSEPPLRYQYLGHNCRRLAVSLFAPSRLLNEMSA